MRGLGTSPTGVQAQPCRQRRPPQHARRSAPLEGCVPGAGAAGGAGPPAPATRPFPWPTASAGRAAPPARRSCCAPRPWRASRPPLPASCRSSETATSRHSALNGQMPRSALNAAWQGLAAPASPCTRTAPLQQAHLAMWQPQRRAPAQTWHRPARWLFPARSVRYRCSTQRWRARCAACLPVRMDSIRRPQSRVLHGSMRLQMQSAGALSGPGRRLLRNATGGQTHALEVAA
mmetsp:Transcript_99187/g.319845  ORF Transcript_99187/g.319845 Transcript_99187/m.319845 type:complete len:233 (-) Transcript_99187:176-874(-)